MLIVGLVSALWVSNTNKRTWRIQRPCKTYEEKYDEVQLTLAKISCADDLLSGLYVDT